MSDFTYFQKFIPKKKAESASQKTCWSYTRVSSKDQLSNHSLENQKKAAYEFSSKRQLQIVNEFGYTYESAKDDFTRKEFREMIDKCKRAKIKPNYILIFVISRFSRNVKSIGIVEQLIELGIHLIEVSSGLTTENEDDRLTIYHKLLEARKENLNRLKLTLPGMKTHLLNGGWLGTVPRGYVVYGKRARGRYAPEQKIEITEEGRQIVKAWKWKLEGMKDTEIMRRLASIGVQFTKQHLSRMWRIPFYCGVSTNRMLESPVEGKWEKMVSIKDFQLIQKLLEKNNSGYKVEIANEDRPLKGTLKCSKCGDTLVGYEKIKVNKKREQKKIQYYRCNYCAGESYNGNSTKRAQKKGVHELFEHLLVKFYLDNDDVQVLELQLRKKLAAQIKDSTLNETTIKNELTDIEEKKKKLRIRAGLEEIPMEVYAETLKLLTARETVLREQLLKCNRKLSDQNFELRKLLKFAGNVRQTWKTGDFEIKQSIQNLVFPEGLVINREKGYYLTKRFNTFFSAIASFTASSEQNKKGLTLKIQDKSSNVAGAGLEPTTFGL